MTNTTVKLTPRYYEQLIVQRDDLIEKHEEISQKLQEVYQADSHAEDSIYSDTMMDLTRIEIELNRIDYLLENGQITQHGQSSEISFGSEVTLQAAGQQLNFTLVDEHEANPFQHKISHKSLLGQALLGKKPGDTVSVVAPAGEMHYSIVHVN